MTVTTNVPGPTFTDKGFVAPSEQAVLNGVQVDINAAFNGGVNPALNTPQGQLASSTAALVGVNNDAFCYQANQFDPAYAAGRYQDGLARIYFIERNPSQPTIVQATCLGGQGVIIPVGALARAADGNVYTCTEDGIIPASGTVDLPFACNETGPIACPAGSLSTIFRAIPGWDSITNSQDGVLGNEVEGRAAFEARRRASVALNARGSLQAVQGAVLNIAGVLDAYVTENVTNSPLNIGGATLAAHSLYVAAIGGDLDAIAKAIWSKKSPGCGYNGNTTRTVIDDNPSYSAPLPSYAVTFEVPPSLPILFAVNIADGPLVPADAVTQIQDAIMAAFAGADGGPRARIGSTIYASRYNAPVAALGPWAQIITLFVGSLNTPGAIITGAITDNALAVSAVSSGAVAVGQSVFDGHGGIIAGTTVLSGAHPNWVLSNSQTVGSETMLTATANLSRATAQINQVPTLARGNIQVTVT